MARDVVCDASTRLMTKKFMAVYGEAVPIGIRTLQLLPQGRGIVAGCEDGSLRTWLAR